MEPKEIGELREWLGLKGVNTYRLNYSLLQMAEIRDVIVNAINEARVQGQREMLRELQTPEVDMLFTLCREEKFIPGNDLSRGYQMASGGDYGVEFSPRCLPAGSIISVTIPKT